TEVISKILDYEDRTTCILFGDGAGAAVISKSKTPGILSIKISADGSAGELLHMPGGGSRMPASEQSLKDRAHFLKMKGNDVFKVAVKMMESSTIEALEKAGISHEDIDLFIPHQANSRILEVLRKRLGISSDKIFSNLEKYGNTSSASVPLALDEAIRSGKAKEGDTILFSVFGAGFTWGSAVVKL
ncbi:MAG: 3-oxoacyl-[acyl-carrier-protein] synthase III C-terminal domain-containing protein, partial [Thermodesulfobacteriota bacterium]